MRRLLARPNDRRRCALQLEARDETPGHSDEARGYNHRTNQEGLELPVTGALRGRCSHDVRYIAR
jgi:hypothetical protein